MIYPVFGVKIPGGKQIICFSVENKIIRKEMLKTFIFEILNF